jgi:imidazolonepropionase
MIFLKFEIIFTKNIESTIKVLTQLVQKFRTTEIYKMKTVLTNIKQLLQIRKANVHKVSGAEMKVLPILENAYLIIENDVILDFGLMKNLPKIPFDKKINCQGRLVLPTWCDSHTHLVFAANRAEEFVDRINGLSYQEIANKGGGILNSAKKLNQMSENDLYKSAAERLKKLIKLGTGAIEIKSGYGLSVQGELKMLQVIQKLKQNFNLPIKATFLGAHAFPLAFKDNKEAYIDLIINEMLPEIASKNLADFIDVFCETNYFDVEQSRKIIKAGKKIGLEAKIHVNQFTSIGGIEMAVSEKARSVDHLEVLTNLDLEILKTGTTMPVALPSCSFFISISYTPARAIIDSGLPIALASDYNPGTTPSGNMNFVMATACIKMKMTPEESINAATINGAFAMNVSEKVGSITVGKKANLIITKPLDSYFDLPYLFADNLIEDVIINGELF